MHSYTLFLIGAWVLGSGVIAYVCDNMGRKLGKKRLSLWGLRPRHTAMLFTVLTGIGIAAVTVGLVALTVPDAKFALFQVRAIRQEAERLASEVKGLSFTQKDLEKRNSNLIEHNNTLNKTAREAEARAGESERKAGLAHLKLTQAVHRRGEIQQELTATQSRLSRLSANRVQLMEQVRISKGRLTGLTQQLSNARDNANKLRTQQAKAMEEAEAARNRVAFLQKQIASETLKLGGLTTELNSVTESLEITQKELAARKKLLDMSKDDYLLAAQSSVAFRQGDILYTTNQEIARRVVYHPDDLREVNLQIVKLLESADEEARAKGARHPMPGNRSVELAPYAYQAEDGKPVTMQESDQILRFSQLIVQDKKDVVIRLVAAANSFKGEPVQANLEVTTNALIFKRGDVIAQDEIDGRLSEAEIMDSLVRMLMGQVRVTAFEKGMLESPSGSLGGINWGQLLDAMHEIKARNAVSEVQIISQTDAWTADPLTVRFALQS